MPQTHTPDRYLYTQNEAAALIHPDLSPRTMERWRRDGTGPRFTRVGRRVGYTREAIEEYLQAKQYSHTAAERQPDQGASVSIGRRHRRHTRTNVAPEPLGTAGARDTIGAIDGAREQAYNDRS